MNAPTRLGVWLCVLCAAGLTLSAAPRRAAGPETGVRRLLADRSSSALSPEQKARVQRAIDAIKNNPPGSLTYRDSTGAVDTLDVATIAASLQKQLDDGRIKVDSTLSAHDYAVSTTDGRASDAADEVDFHKDVVSGADSVFLQEVLIHEWKHKTQVNGSEAADEIEAYSLEKSYKDSLGLDTTYTHFRECVDNLAHFIAEADSVASAAKLRRRSAIVDAAGFRVQAVLADPDDATSGGFLHWRLPGDSDWSPPWPVLGGLVRPVDLLRLDHGRLLLAGNTAMGAGALVRLGFGPTGLVDEQLLLLSFGSEFHCMSAPPGMDGAVDVLDRAQPRVLRYVDSTGDGVPDSFLGVFAELETPALRADWAQHPVLGEGLLTGADDRLYSHLQRLLEPLTLLRDTDGDGHADSADPVLAWEFLDRVPVVQEPLPAPGDQLAFVSGSWMHEIQLWSTTQAGLPLDLLGGALQATPDAQLPLVRPLQDGEWIRAFDASSGQWQGRSVFVGEDLGDLLAPQNLRIEIRRQDGSWFLSLDWDAVAGADYYRIETDPGVGFWLPFADSPSAHYELQLPGALPPLHLFRVRARN